LVYADYTDRGNHFFSIFLIRDKLDENFIQKDGVITIDEVIHVDTDKLAMACRINIESYQSYTQGDSGTYLGFISIKQPDTSIYFLDWIGAEKKERSTEDSRNLVKILNGIPVPQENGKAMGKDNFRKKAYDAIRSFGTSPININSLSAVLFGDDSIINAYAEENNIILNTEFVSDKKTVKRLVSYYINADGIELQFPPEYLGGKISFDTNDPSLVIIRSEKFASAIKEQDSEWKI
jgi:nucleoid-associated protein YejK